jgi:hypothetical protein
MGAALVSATYREVLKVMTTPEITGYRELSLDELSNINIVKAIADQVGTTLDILDGTKDVDKRWLAIARTDLQKGFMSLVRSIAKPTSF